MLRTVTKRRLRHKIVRPYIAEVPALQYKRRSNFGGEIKKGGAFVMALADLYDWNKKGATCGGEKPAACGSACGAGDEPKEKPSACGAADEPKEKPTACGACDK